MFTFCEHRAFQASILSLCELRRADSGDFLSNLALDVASKMDDVSELDPVSDPDVVPDLDILDFDSERGWRRENLCFSLFLSEG